MGMLSASPPVFQPLAEDDVFGRKKKEGDGGGGWGPLVQTKVRGRGGRE